MSFLLRHVDSLIQLALGVAFLGMGFRRAGRVHLIFRVCGAGLLVTGSLLLLRPESWQRRFTADQGASAEFPGAPSLVESTDTQGAVSVKRTSLQYKVAGKDIALFLSYSQLPEQARGWTDEQLLASTVAGMTSQGSKVLQSQKVGSVHRLTLRQDDKQVTLQLALAYAHDNVYRAVASWSDGQEDQPLTDRFVRSFSLK